MSITNKLLIPETTGAANSAAFDTIRTVVIMAGALVSDETVTVDQTHDGVTWRAMTLNGVVQQLTATHSLITLSGPGKFRVVKSATASAISVNMWRGS